MKFVVLKCSSSKSQKTYASDHLAILVRLVGGQVARLLHLLMAHACILKNECLSRVYEIMQNGILLQHNEATIVFSIRV